MDNTDTMPMAQVRDLFATVIAGIRIGNTHEDRVYSLQEVHERTGWALRELKEDCRLHRIEHTRRGRAIGMTSSQIAKEILRGRTGGNAVTAGTEAAEADALAQVREASRAAQNRSPRRRQRPAA
jgi:hypothetical protein